MNKNLLKSPILYLVFFLFNNDHVCGQIENFIIDYLHQSDVSKMHFDDNGYMWFHNNKDFYRYNGHQIDEVGLKNLLGQKKYDDYFLSGEIIMVEDSILFLNDNKVRLIDPATKVIRNVWQLPDNNYFRYLYQDEKGNIWLFASTWDNSEEPVYRSTDGKNFDKVFDLNDHIGSQGVFWTYYELDDKDGHLYFLWRNGDMLILDYEGNEVELKVEDDGTYLDKKSCSQFRLDNKKNLWRIYNSDFGIYDQETKTFIPHELTGTTEFVTDCKLVEEEQNKREGLAEVGSMLNLKYIYSDNAGRIWLACAASYLVCYDPTIGGFINFRQPIVDALGSGDSDIERLLEDDANNLWGFKKGGMFKIRESESYFDSYLVDTKESSHAIHSNKSNDDYNKVVNFYNDYAIRNSVIHSIDEDDQGRLILQEGVFTFGLDPELGHVELLPVFAPYESVHISFNKDLKIFGVWNSYYKFDENLNAVKMKTPMLKLENTFVQRNGDVWVTGLLSKKSYLFTKLDKSLEFDGNYSDPTGNINFALNKVFSIDEDEANNLWLGTLEGLIYYDLSANTFNSYGDSLHHESGPLNISAVATYVEYVDDGRLWFATVDEIGLLETSTRKLIHYLPLDIDAIGQNPKLVTYGDSVVWIGHNQGLTYYNFNSNESVSVSEDEGIVTDGAINVMKRHSSGRIAVGTNNGLYLFHPDSLLNTYSNQRAYQLKIPMGFNSYSIIEGDSDDLQHYPFIQDANERIELAYNDKMLEIQYSIINFDYPDRHLFSYMLEGYDADWSLPSKENTAKYTSLPVGDYTFKAKATTGSGVWSENTISIPVRIHQAWFYSWWFALIVIGTFAFVSYILTRYYYKEKLAKRLAIEKLRTKISNDLHDDVGSTLSGLAIQSELMSMTMPEQDKQELLEISATSRSVMERMRDIVWALNSDRDKFENLVDRMRTFAETQFKNTTLDYTIDLQNIKGQAEINPDVRQNLYYIFKEAVTNTIKHSNGNLVNIKLYKEKARTVLSIKDNGTVFDKSAKEGIGLSSMQSRAKEINGAVIFDTSSGFEVRVEINGE